MTTQWVVVIEATAPEGGAAVPISAVRELMEQMATMHPTTLYNPERYALQVVVSADTPSDALLHALTAWRTAEAGIGLPRRQLTRVEVITPSEFERERSALERSPAGNRNGRNRQADEGADDLLRRAFHDPLTGLANRDLFLSHFDHVLRRAARMDVRHALLLCDLDDFKLVDEHGGVANGEHVLIAVAQRISSTVRPGDSIARVGDGQFALLLAETTTPESVTIAQRLMRCVAAPIDIGGRQVSLTASIGIAVAEPGADPARVLREAREALAAAKALGKNRCEAFEGLVCPRDEALPDRRQLPRPDRVLHSDIAVREGNTN